MIKRQIVTSFILMTCLILTACAPANVGLSRPQLAGPQTWFDAPLPNSVCYPPSPCQIVAHGSDPGGISQFELSVNGSVAATIPSPSTSQSLVTLNYAWTPPKAGSYTLSLRARNNQGNWSGKASTIVVVNPPTAQATTSGGEVKGVVYADTNGNGNIEGNEGPLGGVTVELSDCGAPLTQVTATDGKFDFTNLPAGTCHVQVSKPGWVYSGSFPLLSYPMPASSDPNLPTAFSMYMAPATPTPSGATVQVVGASASQIYWGNCQPNVVTFQVHAVDPAGIKVVVLFFRVVDSQGHTTEFASKSMNSMGGDLYTMTINPSGQFGSELSGFSGGSLQYQAVIQENGGDTSHRTSLLSGVTLVMCGSAPPQPHASTTPGAGPTATLIPVPILIIPTATQIIVH